MFIVKDFINDDHEHSYSVSSLSVQVLHDALCAHYTAHSFTPTHSCAL